LGRNLIEKEKRGKKVSFETPRKKKRGGLNGKKMQKSLTPLSLTLRGKKTIRARRE